MTDALEFVVLGTPAPQGSKTRTRFGMRDDNAQTLKPWREAVKHAALAAIAEREGTGAPFAILGGALNVTATFYFARPKGHYGTGRNAQTVRPAAPDLPTGKPDLDKVIRSTFDALTDAGVWLDDKHVAMVTALKVYADPYRGVHPGASIRAEQL